MPDIARLRELLEKATPRPWPSSGPIEHDGPVAIANAHLMIEAVSALPALLDRLESAEAHKHARANLADFVALSGRMERGERALEFLRQYRDGPPTNWFGAMVKLLEEDA